MLCWSHWLRGLRPATLNDLNDLRKTIMATQAEQAQILRTAVDQLKKSAGEIAVVQTETNTLKTRVAELEAIVAAGGDASPELVAAVQAVKDQSQVVDDAIPDPPVVPPAPTP